ncbi:hypothetical protein D1AOALGA4SA_327, partial [Olavius algarvensis Delta 1 endosymbiont]
KSKTVYMEVLILTTSHFKSSGHNHLQDIRPYLSFVKVALPVNLCYSIFRPMYNLINGKD